MAPVLRDGLSYLTIIHLRYCIIYECVCMIYTRLGYMIIIMIVINGYAYLGLLESTNLSSSDHVFHAFWMGISWIYGSQCVVAVRD